MTRIGVFCALILDFACTPGGDDTSSDTSAASTTATTTTIGGSETGAPGEATNVPTTSAGTGGADSGGGDTGGASTSTSTSTSAGETGEGGLCGGGGAELLATLEPLGVPDVPDCGTVDFLARTEAGVGAGVFELDACGCEALCESPIPWRLTFGGPAEVVPTTLPPCNRVVFERVWNAEHTACEFAAMTLWDAVMSSDIGIFHAATRLEPTTVATGAGWEVERSDNETCACDECCRTPTLLDLSFSFGGTKLLQLAEGHDSLAAPLGGQFRFFNLRSHDAGACDEAEAIDWVIRAEP